MAVKPHGSKPFILLHLVTLLLTTHTNHPLYLDAPCTSFIAATTWKEAECPTIGEYLCKVGHPLKGLLASSWKLRF